MSCLGSLVRKNPKSLGDWPSPCFLRVKRCGQLAKLRLYICFEPHGVQCLNYKPYMVQLRMRLAIFIREKRGTATQREFARKIGVAQSTIMRIENLDQNVTIDTLERLCQIFHTDVEGLFPASTTSKVYPTSEQRLGVVHERPVNAKLSKPKPPAKR